MDQVTDIRTRRPGQGEPPHIDAHRWWLLVNIAADLAACRVGDSEPQRRADLQSLTDQLNSLLARFNPPKGAA